MSRTNKAKFLQNNTRTAILVVGVIFILSGVVLISWRLWMASRPQQWQIQVQGLVNIPKQDIESLVLYLLRSPQGISKQEIEQALLLNPRIEKVQITIENKKMTLQITERLAALLVQRPPQILELSSDMQILQENLLPTAYDLNPSLPIFFLNHEEGGEKHKKEFTKYQRDIIRLWKATQSSYSFIWGRISEIETVWKNNKAHFYIYLSTRQVKIHLSQFFSRETLRRLWATFYYLENVSPSSFPRQIELYKEHAIVRQQQVESNGL